MFISLSNMSPCTNIYRSPMNPSRTGAKSAAGDNTGSSRVFHPEDYVLIRVSNVKNVSYEDVSGLLHESLRLLVPLSIMGLGDGSWEICVFKSHIPTVQGNLRKILPNSDSEVSYDPL